MALESQILNRSMGLLSQQAFHRWFSRSLIDTLTPASAVTFDSSSTGGQETGIWAHRTGVNVIALDRFEGHL